MRLIDADAFKEDLKKGTEFALGRAMVQGTLTKEKEKQVDETLKGFLEDIDAQPTVSEWIPVAKQTPEEEESIFANTIDKNTSGGVLWRNQSREVEVTIEFSNGKRLATTSCTQDGKWRIEKNMRAVKVIAWKPFSKPYEGD